MQEISKIVLERLQKQSAAEVHPDANLLTAFAERGLAENERAQVVEHLAHCGDCRDVIALALPALEEMGANAAVAARRKWFSWPTLRWGLVAAGVAAVASVGVVQFEHRQMQVKEGVFSAEVARNEPSASSVQGTAPSVELPGATVAAKQATAETSSKGFVGGRTNSLDKNPIAKKVPAKPRLSGTPTALPAVGVEQKSGTAAGDEIAQSQVSDQLVHRSAASPDVVKAKNPSPVETPAAIAAPNVPLQTEPAMMVRALPRWSISTNGGLQRSFDAGGSWEDVNVEVADYSPQAANEAGSEAQSVKKAAMPPVFRAVAAIGPEVWAGGAKGVLYHSADSGTRWTKILPSGGEAVLTGDITGIQFSDAQHGAITTSGGEVWATSDNGQSWIRRP
jgi:hypothetical protein